jgi:hypothetical protein
MRLGRGSRSSLRRESRPVHRARPRPAASSRRSATSRARPRVRSSVPRRPVHRASPAAALDLPQARHPRVAARPRDPPPARYIRARARPARESSLRSRHPAAASGGAVRARGRSLRAHARRGRSRRSTAAAARGSRPGRRPRPASAPEARAGALPASCWCGLRHGDRAHTRRPRLRDAPAGDRPSCVRNTASGSFPATTSPAPRPARTSPR